MFVFPGTGKQGHRGDVRNWTKLCKAAGIKNARPHDLRHSYASFLASGGKSLLVLGRLLGHTQAATTHRYAHIHVDPLREATESVSAKVLPTRNAEVIELSKGGKRG